MAAADDHVKALQALVAETAAGLAELERILAEQPAPVPGGAPAATSQGVKDAVASTIRGLYGPMTQAQWSAIESALDSESLPDRSQVGLTRADFDWASDSLACSYAQIRAVDEVESGGGWFTDVRASILDLDGPAGFISGPALPKILFEAHQFDKHSGGKFRASHPNLSSRTWNRALYVGGVGEWERLHKAMQLDEAAALKSASVGRYQIMGFNHKLAGFHTVRAFWDAMMESERRHLEAFVAFIKNSGMGDKLRRIDGVPANCVPFAAAYNGSGHAKNNYAGKLAAAFRKHS